MTAVLPVATCLHTPPCPPSTAPDHDAARVVFHDYTAGFSITCTGVVLFDDTGETLPDGTAVEPHRPEPLHKTEEN